MVKYFLPTALLFGQAGAVYGFNRVSKFLVSVCSRCADLVVSGHYDDFSQIEVEELASSAREALTTIFNLLGFQLAVDAINDLPFAKKFAPLGVDVDINESKNGII